MSALLYFFGSLFHIMYSSTFRNTYTLYCIIYTLFSFLSISYICTTLFSLGTYYSGTFFLLYWTLNTLVIISTLICYIILLLSFFCRCDGDTRVSSLLLLPFYYQYWYYYMRSLLFIWPCFLSLSLSRPFPYPFILRQHLPSVRETCPRSLFLLLPFHNLYIPWLAPVFPFDDCVTWRATCTHGFYVFLSLLPFI